MGGKVKTATVLVLLLTGMLIFLNALLFALLGYVALVVPMVIAGGVLLVIIPRIRRRRARRRQRVFSGAALVQTHQHVCRAPGLKLTLSPDGRPSGGIVIAGSRTGQRLENLSLDALLEIGASFDESDTQSLTLIVRYLDSAHPGWRDGPTAAAEGRTDRRRHDEPRPDVNDPRHADRRAALRLLGLAEGASAAEICAAHRRLIKRVHPDVGGSSSLTAEINQARTVLLAHGGDQRLG